MDYLLGLEIIWLAKQMLIQKINRNAELLGKYFF